VEGSILTRPIYLYNYEKRLDCRALGNASKASVYTLALLAANAHPWELPQNYVCGY